MKKVVKVVAAIIENAQNEIICNKRVRPHTSTIDIVYMTCT